MYYPHGVLIDNRYQFRNPACMEWCEENVRGKFSWRTGFLEIECDSIRSAWSSRLFLFNCAEDATLFKLIFADSVLEWPDGATFRNIF